MLLCKYTSVMSRHFFKILQLCVAILLQCVMCQEFGTTLSLKQGMVIGRILKTSNGRDFYAFRGIPYATAPVGLLRFKDPMMYPGWAGTLDARDYRSPCPQLDIKGMMKGQEDCLFVNIFTPSLPATGSYSQVTYPVMVFIHGGNFEEGASNSYGPGKLMDKGIIVVTFNYRMGLLGFLSTGDDVSPGNMGLKDQVLAIRWVRENVDRFGGDPNSITIFGQGSGAASVFLHLLSPQSQGLFSRAILQSGSGLCDWALEGDPYGYAREVAQRLHCPTGSSRSIVDCIRMKPVQDILGAQRDNKIFGDFPLRAVPVVEKTGDNKFLPDSPINLLNAGNFRRVPIIAGVNRDEGAFFYPMLYNTYRDALRDDRSFLRNHLIPMFLLTTTNIRGNIDSVTESILFEYFSRADRSNVTHLIHPFVNMSTDAMYVSCNDMTVHLYAESGGPTYMYSFEYRGQNSMADLQYGTPVPYFDPGVSNGDELLYLFNLDIEGLKQPSLLDNLVSGRLVTLWTDFAKYGDAPQYINYEYPRWEQYRPDIQNYYRIERDLRPANAYRQRAVDMWNRYLPALAGMTNPTTSPLIQELRTASLYRTLAWAMVSVSVALLAVVLVLLVVLYNQKKSQSFKASTETQSRMSGSTLY